MEEIIRDRLLEIWRSSSIPPSKEKVDAYMRELKTDAGRELLKLAIDLKQVDCDFKTHKGGEYYEFRCTIYSIPQQIILEPMKYGKNIKIIIFNADDELTGADLRLMNYNTMSYDAHRGEQGYRADYYKIVPVDDLEKELLTYLKKIEWSIKDRAKLYKRGEQGLELLKEYLEEELK